ncbi:MAG TPA: hypothetical protein VF100_08690, partial [Thermoanaerobaculia bacterium]
MIAPSGRADADDTGGTAAAARALARDQTGAGVLDAAPADPPAPALPPAGRRATLGPVLTGRRPLGGVPLPRLALAAAAALTASLLALLVAPEAGHLRPTAATGFATGAAFGPAALLVH